MTATAISNPDLLPATVLDVEDDWTPSRDIRDYSVNDRVAVYSRGRVRLAIVAKTGKTNIVARYTTQGAWKEAERIRDMYLGVNPETNAAAEAKLSGKNYDYTLSQTTDEAVEAQVAKWPTLGRDYHEAHRAKSLAFIAEHPDREAFVQAAYDRKLQYLTEQKAIAKKDGASTWVTVTEKRVKITDILGHWPTIEKEAR